MRDGRYGLWFWVEGDPFRLGNLSALSFLSRSCVS
ncbi:hypothetical protein RCCS2_07989 [Roseobacter sp. CCS2]|nr:hypothetical protein RCCS2_07989 [Roseobacter sp. CCS2]